jgi:hypothetical protein
MHGITELVKRHSFEFTRISDGTGVNHVSAVRELHDRLGPRHVTVVTEM